MEPRIKKVDFGDGYTQQAPDGINSQLAKWSLNWEALTVSEKNTIEGFLAARQGYQTFTWIDPSGTTYKVKCPNWSVSEFAPKVFSIKASFNQTPI